MSMESFIKQCESALVSLSQVSETNTLDDYEQRAIQYMIARVQKFTCDDTLALKYKGELSRMVQEFNPSKFDPKLGASLIEIENFYFK